MSVDTASNQIIKMDKSVWTNFIVKCSHFDVNDISKLLDIEKGSKTVNGKILLSENYGLGIKIN